MRVIVWMVVGLLLAGPAWAEAEDPRIDEVRALDKELRTAARKGDLEPIRRVWSTLSEAVGQETTPELLGRIRAALQEGLRGKATYACRGETCRILTHPTRDESFSLLLVRREGRWVVHDRRGSIGRWGPQISLNLSVSGPGVVRVLLNGNRTFLIDDLEGTSIALSSIDDEVVSGLNRISVQPLTPGTAPELSLRIGSHPHGAEIVDTARGDLLQIDAKLEGPTEWSFTVEDPPAPRPDRLLESYDRVQPSPEALSALRPVQDQVRRCFEAALVDDPDTEGLVVIEWVMRGDGTAGKVRVVEDSTGSATLAACIATVMEALRFDPADGAADRPVVTPFSFVSAD